MDDLVRQGKVLYVGVSNWSAWQIAMALGQSAQSGLSPIRVIQPMYNLAKRTAEVEILALSAADYSMTPQQYAEIGALTPPVPIATDRTGERV